MSHWDIVWDPNVIALSPDLAIQKQTLIILAFECVRILILFVINCKIIYSFPKYKLVKNKIDCNGTKKWIATEPR